MIIILSSSSKNLLGDRQRFSLAFELGHLIMHTFCIVPHERTSTMKPIFCRWGFNACKDILKDFKDGITLPLFGELKRKWKVSMIALLYRLMIWDCLLPIKAIPGAAVQRPENKKAWTSTIRRTQRNPQLMRRLLADFMSKTKLGVIQLCTVLAIEHADYLAYYG